MNASLGIIIATQPSGTRHNKDRDKGKNFEINTDGIKLIDRNNVSKNLIICVFISNQNKFVI